MNFKALDALPYRKIQKLAMQANVKAVGNRMEIIHRLLGLPRVPNTLRRSERIVRPITSSKDQLGHAMKFNWPDQTPDNDDQTRLLMQVWTQLVEIKTQSDVLSSSETSIFMAHGEGDDGNTLSILSTGQLNMKDLKLPKANAK
ncbi:hypothetical protein B0H21DRAFT_821591 [Amylocystis lapponica]|nr:hypothetical protein B0H21DRAFT_821591 [Amylocystis lapponica]